MKYATLVISILIIIAVLIPGSNLPDVRIGGYDKLVHIVMFFVWALAVRYDFETEGRFVMLKYVAIGLLFSALTEVLQIAIEGRSFDIYDMLADFIGLILGLLVGKPLIGQINRWKA